MNKFYSKPYRLLLFIVISACTAITACAQNGSLDASFGVNGKAITDFGGANDFATCMVLQGDKKIVVGGYVTLAAKQYFALVRYSENGAPDSSFGTNGKVTTGFDGIDTVYLESMKLQADGRIITGGYLINGVNDNFVLVRYKTNGSPDSTFGDNGVIITPLTGHNNRATSIEIAADGSIIVAGSINCKPAVRRYEPNGNNSLFFAQLGANVADLEDCYNTTSIVAIVAFASQKVVVGGNVTGTQDEPAGSSSADNMFLMRLDLTGTGKVDSTFGKDGTVKTSIKDTASIFAITPQTDGKIITVGYDAATAGPREFTITRYQPDGALDPTFGTGGEVKLPFTGSAAANAVAMGGDGKIVVTGSLNNGTRDEIVALVAGPNGRLDSTFGNNGEVITDDGLADDAVASIIQPDGKVLVAGYTLSADTTGYNFIVLRYNANDLLPVKLSTFTASSVKSDVLLNWTTASELNTSYFSIERSSTSANFTSIGNVRATGNSNISQQYDYIDQKPLKGDNFYRLKEVDKDGHFSYSKTIHIAFGDAPFIKAYPNPVVNTVKVSGLTSAASISIIDASGKPMQQYKTTGGGEYSVNVQNLAPGLYFLKVLQDGKITTLKMVKQ